MKRSLFATCAGATAIAVLLSGLTLLTPRSASATEPSPSTQSDAWVAPSSADDWAYEGANVPDVPLPDKSARSFQTSDAAARVAPTGTTVAAPGLGALPYFSFQEYSLSANMVARVNVANGNLLLTANDASLTGPGLALRHDRFYNGLSTSNGAFGGGWSSSLYERDVRLDVDATKAVYTGANGFQATFTKSGETWVAPPGFNASLLKHAPQGDPRDIKQSEYSLTFNKSGERTEFSGDGWLIGQFDRNGIGNTWTYPDAYENATAQVSVRNKAGRGFNILRNEDGRIETVRDSAGRATTYTFGRDANRSLVRVDGLAGATEEYSYDAQGRVTQITFSSSTSGVTPRVKFYYDASNRVVGIERSQVESSGAYSYEEFGYGADQSGVMDAEENHASFRFDTQGRVTSTIDQLQRTRSSTWTTSSDVATSTDALGSGSTPGNSTTYGYDELGNQKSVSAPTGAAASALYATGVNCAGSGGTAFQVKCSTSENGASVANTYDAAGNLLTQKDTTASGSGAVVQTNTYQGTNGAACGGFQGQICSSTDGNNQRTLYAYSTSGDITKVTPPAPLGATSYVYDALGRIVSVVDGNQKTTAYAYDQRDQLVKTTWSDGSTLTSTYVSGLKTKEVDSLAGQRNFAYDFRGLVTREDGPGAGVTTYSYDRSGNLTTSVTPNGTTQYVYDAANQLISMVEPGGSCPGGAPSAGSGCVTFEYDSNGAETKRNFPGGASVSTTHDKSGRPSRITARNTNNVPVVDLAYSYSSDGTGSAASDRSTIQSKTSYVEVGVAQGAVTSYTYDSLGRVTSANERSGTTATASWAYAYDKAGNRTSQTRAGATGAAAGTTAYTYNSANQLMTSTGAAASYSYDNAGNQTRNGATGQVTSYNSRQAATKIGATGFSAFGQGNSATTSRTNPGGTFANTSQGLTAATIAGGTTAYTRTAAGALVAARLPGANASYFVLDSLGSVVGLFDKAGAFKGGYSYSPYGEARATSSDSTVGSNPMRYIGGYFESSTNSYRFGARYYDPAQGRFTQFDPSGQEANPYAYGNGDPVNSLDPSGLNAYSFFGLVTKLIGIVLAGGEIARNPSAKQIATSLVAFGVGEAIGAVCTGILLPSAATVVTATAGLALCAVASTAISNFATSGKFL